MTDLDLKYRPRTLDEVVGQEAAIKTIRSWGRHVPRCVLLHGPSGCLRGDTPIHDPVDGSTETVRSRFEVGREFHVYSWDEAGGKLVVTKALPPLRYPKTRMVRVETSVGVFHVTADHRILTVSGEYVRVQTFLQRRQAFADTQLLSISEPVRSVRSAGVPHSIRRVPDYLGDYRPSFYSCGEPPRGISTDDPVSVPSLSDAPLRTHVRVRSQERTHQRRSVGHPSMTGFYPPASLFHAEEYSSALKRRGLYHETCGISGQVLLCSSRTNTGFSFPDHARASTFSAGTTSFPWSVEKPPSACDSPTGYEVRWAMIKNIVEVEQDVYFDFHVPIYNNYWAGGLIHHNCGKTTLARVIARDLGVTDGSMDLSEVNCGILESPIAAVRELAGWVAQSPMNGNRRVWILDEVQTLSRQKGSQEALLKILEDSPAHNQFFLCTTDPKRILKTVVGRCVEVGLRALKPAELRELVNRIAAAECVKLSTAVADRVVELANGGARDAVKSLQKILGLADPEEQLAALGGLDDRGDAFRLARALLYDGKPSWARVAPILADLDEDDPESLRLMVMAAARTTMLKGGAAAAHAYKVIVCLEKPLFDRGSGKPLLAAACYEICNAK